MMSTDGIGLFLMLASFVLTFLGARMLGKHLKAKREAEKEKQAERALAKQSRQVRRAAQRKKQG